MGVTYDTNINNSGTNPLSDLILQPSIDARVFWPITRVNELAINLGFSYEYYLFNPDFGSSGLRLTPGSGLNFRVFSGDFVFTLYDYPSIRTNPPQSQPGLTNTGFFEEFSNTVGLSVLWDWNKLISTVGVQRSDRFSLNSNFSSINETSYSLYGQSAYTFTPTTTIGVRGNASVNDFTTNTLNNSITSQFGVFLNSTLTQYTTAYVEVGVQSGIFTNDALETPTPTFEQNSEGLNVNVESTLGGGNYLQPYFIVGLNNRLNRFLTHDLFVSREVISSDISNFQEEYTLSYSINYKLRRFTSLRLLGYGSTGTVSSSTSPEPFYRAGFSATLSHRFMKNGTLDLSYDFFLANYDDEDDGSYTRQRVSLRVNWLF